MIKYKTRKDLIEGWLKIHPDDKDFEFNAIAAHVLLESGLYVDWDEFIYIKNNKSKTTKITLDKTTL